MPSLPRRAFCHRLAAAGLVSLIRPAIIQAAPVSASVDLRPVMRRAAACCLAWLNPEQQFLPTGGYEVAHDTGRWWDAMLRYEAATGDRIPEAAEAAMMKNLRALTDNPAALLTAQLCNPHNLRETLLAYTALVKYRQDPWAREQAVKLIATTSRLLEADGQLDYAALAPLTGKPLTKDLLMITRVPAGQWFNATGSTGRMIEALVWFHEVTGDEPALQLAGRLARVNLAMIIDPSGRIRPELLDPTHVGHHHSYCGTLRGLLRYGLATGDRAYVEAVAQTYRKGLWGSVISHSGWTPHDQGKIRFADKEGDPIGEHGSCGDIVQLALWLALEAGQTDLLDDVERLIRARLIPSQITDPKNPRRDGAWGVYSHPFGFGSILDVFAAVLHSLADVQQHVVTHAKGIISINAHFSIETPFVLVQSHRDSRALLEITPREDCPLRIRVPAWAPRDSLQLTAGDHSLQFQWDGSYLVINRASNSQRITLQHDLPEFLTTEKMPISHRQFHLTWRGDSVSTCDPPTPIYSKP